MPKVLCFIYWRNDFPEIDGYVFANIHLLEGYNQGTVADFIRMAEKLRETFPQASNDKIHAGKVTESRFVKGFTIVTFNAYIPRRGNYIGWEQFEATNIEYGF